ncbi:MAG: Crossover junction endodeoxyribonuclease RuvC [Candidatus Gottesmanbacteria bacterium GW2011_GWC2_39_8]|uniref:Crossover junction endodeoxyribonuclease RuvC n=1 Tax=Candidatus Gottesmanbacteria bacterium GW2011_GWC2_39_8 TaxID=1618450 RepID=A0A0G0Q6E4_9BACT|nr:MAG: Crossover junction endodeoxyribonuclease RuvC [Candidatus Gottesmanbacteria bacterium GW2011_GWC2_39_8]
MIVLGIDPGIAITGWSVVEEKNGKQKLLGYGTIETSKDITLPKRLITLYNDLNILISKYSPEVAVLERIFFNTNTKSAIIVGQARGVAMLTCEKNKLECIEYTPLQVKMALTGYGRADKNQMQQMVKTIFGLKTVPQPDDAADAVAIALGHCFSYRGREMLNFKY